MKESVTIRLSIMMFVQFFVWGAWYVTGPNYLGTIGFGAGDFGWMYSVGPIAGMISPLFVGLIADRFFSAQRVLGVMHLAGGGIMFAATTLMQAAEPSPNMINIVFFGYMLTFFPTLSLTNTIAMRSMTNSEQQFPLIRVFGTIGWIAAGLLLSFMGPEDAKWETTVSMFYLAAGAAVFLGLYSFALPDTPPVKQGKVTVRELLGLDALVLLKNRSYLVFLVSSILICIPLAFYYQIASRVVEMTGRPIGLTMGYGQMSEIIFMLVMPLFFTRLGVKWMLAVGMLAWVVRYTLFAFGASNDVFWMILIGIVLHGICYDFFFVTGQIYTDQAAPKDLRAQAQGLLVLFTLGLGMFVGAKFAGAIEGMATPQVSKDYGVQVEELGEQIAVLEKQLAAGGADAAELEAEIESLTVKKTESRHQQLRTMDWMKIWGIPAIFAAVVLMFFVGFFRPTPGVVEEKSPKPATT